MTAAMIITLAAIAAAAGIAIYYRKREKRLLQNLQNMIDAAESGNYEAGRVDETMFSLLESSLHRFLKGSQVSAENVELQKRRIQTLISDISHQTITPISNITLYTQLLEEKAAGLDLEREIHAVKEETEKLNFLIDALVKTSRLENGIITVQPQANPVRQLVEGAVDQVGAKAQGKKISIKVEDTPEWAVFDMKWTREALYNILDNAVKYTNPGGNVKVEVTGYSLFTRIDVIDSGIGIAEEEHSKVFGRFYRSPQVAWEEGVGIGLYLAREIISAEGGYIKLSSKQGEGARFSIFLPREEKVSEL